MKKTEETRMDVMSEEPYIPVRILLRNNATREERVYVDSWPQSYIDDGTMEFCLTEGNSACDCNRALYFARAANEHDPNTPCSSVLFTALYAELPDGKRITLDQDEHV